MVPWTDVTFTVRLKNLDLTNARLIHMILKQGEYIEVATSDVTVLSAGPEETWLSVHLTQEQTSVFMDNTPIKLQPNWVDALGERHSTEQAAIIEVGEQLFRKLLEASAQEDDNGS